jgi:serine/threonine protein kinase
MIDGDREKPSLDRGAHELPTIVLSPRDEPAEDDDPQTATLPIMPAPRPQGSAPLPDLHFGRQRQGRTLTPGQQISEPQPDPDATAMDCGLTAEVSKCLANRTAVTAKAMPEAADRTAAGSESSLGRFCVLRAHARGGLGLVSVALDQELNREVAVKQLHSEWADDPESRERCLLEAEITGALEHPGVVPVHALGESPDGRPYYVMRFVQGDTLSEAIKSHHRPDNPNRRRAGERQLALSQLLGRMIDVCNAMEYAHSRGILHRDLKPGNILLGKYGETLVVDWGLAKAKGTREVRSQGSARLPMPDHYSGVQTSAGAVVGTPTYMSPEQAAGKLDELTPSTDIYSLGATLYHLLTGRPPFEKQQSTTLLLKVQRGEFKNPRDVNPEVPSDLQAICLKAMSLNPSNRYSSARELADDIERWLANEPLVAGIFHQLRQRLAVQLERTLPRDSTAGDSASAPAEPRTDDHESQAGLPLLALIPTRRVRFATDEKTGPVDYELASLRAESLLARIYQARQVALDREMVVKAFQPRVLDDEARRRCAPADLARVQATLERRDLECFLSEAVVTANLEHPGIIPVHEVFKDEGGRFYIAMKWIRGKTWNKLLRDRTESENLDTLLKAADVIAYAHERGVLHRDFKPENVFLGVHGETCVVDWGAALVTPDFRSWETLSVFPTWGWGSPLYAAPEQLVGQFDRIDVRSDVYLLGATLFEIVAGFPPHPVSANPSEGLEFLRRNEICPTDYRGPLRDIALKAMATNPHDRFANVQEFQAAIRDCQAREGEAPAEPAV